MTKTTPTLAAETKLTAHKQALLKANPPFGAKHIGSMLGLGFVGLLVLSLIHISEPTRPY